ncbi:MAG: hypothetical protein M0Z39_07740 [Actinomycetota bacterium]|nr:hypothetical protein [Actinomycetota bacterium]
MGSFEEWRANDEVWTKNNIEVLKDNFLDFYQTGEWPELRVLQRTRDIAGQHIPTLTDIAASKPSIPGHGNFTANVPKSLMLNARHLTVLGIPQARSLLDAVVASCVVAVEAYKDPSRDFPITFTDEEVMSRRESLDPHALILVPKFVLSDYPTPFSGGNWSDNGMSLGVSETFVMQFEGAATDQTYVDRQLSIIKGWCDERDQKSTNAQSDRSLRVFLAMPFSQPWSDTTHKKLVEVVHQVDPTIELRRLDQLTSPGRITEQLVAELQQADFLIADVTGANANVAWELGYAEALGKQSVIIRKSDDSTQIPFDIYDRRWVKYDDPFTPQQIEHLRGHLKSAIATARSSAPESVDPGVEFFKYP